MYSDSDNIKVIPAEKLVTKVFNVQLHIDVLKEYIKTLEENIKIIQSINTELDEKICDLDKRVKELEALNKFTLKYWVYNIIKKKRSQIYE